MPSKICLNSSVRNILTLIVFVIKIVNAEKISTPQGEIEGIIKKTVNGREIQAFLGIPFAKPPIDDLRFKSPVPFGKWEGVKEASKDGNECIQKAFFSVPGDSEKEISSEIDETSPAEKIPILPITGSEDCLYLNVFTPDTSVPKKYPVMFFIHGGGFISGSSDSEIYGPDLLLDKKDIVLVVTNYRLGVLGFASTEDAVMSGNYALKDLVLALKWVQENIASYGGNPESVTIFGESAGSVCAHYLTLSPLAKGLFHHAILMSGTAHCHWSTFVPGVVANNTRKLATFLNCPTESSNLLVECLKKVSAKQLTEALDKFQIWQATSFVFHVPVVEPEEIEDAFLTVSPLSAKSNIPMTIGVTNDEGVAFVAALGIKDNFVELNARFSEVLSVGLHYDTSSSNPVEITNKIKEFYFGDVNKLITKENIKQLMDIFGDSSIVECTSSAVENHEGTAYLYVFAHKGNNTILSIFPSEFTKYGVTHGEDLTYLFPLKFPFQEDKKMLEGNDKKMSEEMIELWTNFAKYGNPTPDNEDNKWDVLSIKDMNYYHLEYSKTRMEKGFFKERNNFWKNLGWRDKMTSKNLSVKTEL